MTVSQKYIVIDFDSTFMQVEALEELAEIVLKTSPDKNRIVREIKEITNLGVDGEITFNESLKRRLNLLRANREHLEKLVRRLKRKVSASVSRNRAFFKKYKGQILIISNGFKEFITPIVKSYQIDDKHVLANTFIFDEDDWIVGFDEENPLAHSKGKSKSLKAMNLDGEIFVIGDAYTDFEMVEAGIAHKFFVFTENVLRENILEKADHITPSFDEFLYVNQMPRALSYPKNRIKILLLDNIHPKATEAFETEGYQVERISGSLTEDELCEKIPGVSILGVRSATAVTQKVLNHANRLMSVCAFCVGTSHIDLEACALNGVITFNAPYTNTRSQVELALGNIIMLLRRVPVFSRQMHKGEWKKSSENAFELRGKSIGIIGYGNAGTQLSVLAEAMGMNVLYYDIVEKQAMGNATKCSSLKELLRKSDVICLHVDGRNETIEIIGKAEFKQMKNNAILINSSSGHAVDLSELATHLESGKVLGAAIDVFPDEPIGDDDHFYSKLTGLPNVILTPHISGNTLEAQQNTASFIPSKVIDYVNTGSTFGSVNFPELQLPKLRNAHRLIHVHENMPGILARINGILAEHQINILGQYLKTNEHIGYVITDINKKYGKQVLEDLKKIEHTIKFRVLY